MARETVPAAPFVAWLERQIEQEPDRATVAFRLGVHERILYRWTRSQDGQGRPTDTYLRSTVEDALHRAGTDFGDVYPDLVAGGEDIDLEPDAYCASCRDIVTPISGQCPWCDRATTSELPSRLYCPREDAMRYPANDGNCWRCGSELKQQTLYRKCACGCGTDIPRFSSRGKEVKWVRGHAPRSREDNLSLPVEPFRRWIESELHSLDPIQAIARKTGVSRENILDVLNGRVETIPKQDVRRALHRAAYEGQGRGMPPRPGFMRMCDLYPEYVRSLRCSGCGGKKSVHAELCRKCRLAAGRPSTGREKSLTPDLLQQARELREREGLPFHAIAERIQPRTRCGNTDSVRGMLLVEFRQRGWDTSRIRKAAAAA